jgi:hypothetical protein
VFASPRALAIRRHLLPVLFWAVAFALAIAGYGLTNDHFDRISRARQIARYGELPFRDYFDPGYFLAEFSSAALQRLLGDNLLGELLLNTIFIATGSLVVMLLARRATRSTLVAVAAALIALVAGPRAYDYDKVLFYPLTLLVLWRYLERPRRSRLVALAAAIVAAGLYRYDNGVFAGLAALAGIVAVRGLTVKALREIAALAGTAFVFALPVLLFIAVTAGLGNTVDQLSTYAAREGARTRWTSLPRMQVGRLVAIAAPSAGARIAIRWAPTVYAVGRAQAEARLQLTPQPTTDPAGSTRLYTIEDESSAHLRRIVTDQAVEDTGEIDRARMRLEHPTTMWTRTARGVPVMRTRLLPDFWTLDTTAAAVFYLLIALPIVGLVAMFAQRAQMTPIARGTIASTIVLCVLTDLFILRDPLAARIGGIAGPAAVLGAWLIARLPRRGWMGLTSRLAAAVVLVVLLGSLSVIGNWSHTIAPVLRSPSTLGWQVPVLAAMPPTEDALPRRRDAQVIAYVHECTQPSERVFASWFFPELYWFAQRGFAGGMVVTFGGHWSEPRFQERAVRAFAAQQVPIVLLDNARYPEFQQSYPSLDGYLAAHYRDAGASNFGDAAVPPDAYRVLVSRDRAPVRIDPAWGLPCFA